MRVDEKWDVPLLTKPSSSLDQVQDRWSNLWWIRAITMGMTTAGKNHGRP